jgi:DNA-binding MarR family transcriptional regulator
MDSKVLGFFSRQPGATLSDLAAHSGRDKAQLARLVAGLREGGLLQGEPDPADRRNVRLSLTEAGVAVQQALHAQSRRLAAQAVAGFSGADLAQLDAMLARLRDNLTSADAD